MTKPSDRAIAMAFWEACDTVNLDKKSLVDLLHRIEVKAVEIDAAAPEGAKAREDDQIVRWLRRFDETTEDCGETDLSKEKLAALVTCGYLSRRRAGPHGWLYTMTASGHAAMERAYTAPPSLGGEDQAAAAWRSCYSAIIDQLAKLVQQREPEQLTNLIAGRWDREMIDREYVMRAVTRIRDALDAANKAARAAGGDGK